MLKWFPIITMAFLFFAGLNNSVSQVAPPFYTKEAEHWADSVIKTLTSEERIAQLMMVSAYSNKDSLHIKEIRNLIQNYGIGGLIFFQGGPVREALLTNDYQSISKIPLLISMDAEYGLAMRLDSTLRFPRQMTMSAIRSDSVVYRMGAEIGRNCRRLGIHVNFAPDADINNNPSNPVIGSRSFGDERNVVTQKSLFYMHGLQDNLVLASGKHFPGHGNTDIDSHFALPTIFQDRSEMDSLELYPFRKMIASGLGSVMVAHLNVPSLDTNFETPATLSHPIISGLLKGDLGFRGLIFTDALNMKAVSECYKPGVLEKLALIAGNDILLTPEDARKAIDEIHLGVENCELTQEEIDEHAKKVLMVKYWCGLNHRPYIDTVNLYNDLNNPSGKILQRDLYSKAITLLSNKDSLLPLRSKDSLRIASVVIGDKINNTFQEQLRMYDNIDVFAEDKDAPVSMYEALFNFLSNYDYIILSVHGTNMKTQNGFGIPEVAQRFIDSIMISYKTILVDFGNAYTLSRFNNLNAARAVVLAYEDFPLTHSITAQMVMGAIGINGKIPVSSTPVFARNSGISTSSINRLEYTIPEAAGMSSLELQKIDGLVDSAITACAFPGCQVLVARNGKVVYQKSFGTFTYSLSDTVRNDDLYDIASVTKITATALGAMRLYEKKKIDLDKPVSKYLSKLKNSNKKSITIREILTHQAGLQPWIPFYNETISEGELSNEFYRDTVEDKFNIHVADKIFLEKNYPDTIMDRIYSSPLNAAGKYVYSDLGPILMKEIIEEESGKPFDKFIEDNFFTPLRLSTTTFNPLNKFPRNKIVPTENDTVFRKQLIQGYVHDPAAAMFGGVSGNAGVFSNANNLAVIMQMFLNKGSYGGQIYFKPATVELFTKKQFPDNRRGLLFDKPETDSTKQSPCSKSASALTFGHQGFTGTCAWADPQYGLIYIFLSNRVNPDASNDKLVKMNVRTRIQEIIYKSLVDGRGSVGFK